MECIAQAFKYYTGKTFVQVEINICKNNISVCYWNISLGNDNSTSDIKRPMHEVFEEDSCDDLEQEKQQKKVDSG